MIGHRIKEQLKKEGGAVQIVEATFVFPIMFLILLFLIYMGNAFYIRSQIEAVVESNAIRGANYCADPLLQNLREGRGIPSLSDLRTKPYRHLFGGMSDIEEKISADVENEINGTSVTFFGNMTPKLRGSRSEIAKHHNYVIYATFSVEVTYDIQFPIRYLGESTPPLLTINSRAEVPVGDAAEFIRNTDLVLDLFHGTKVGKAVSDVFSKVNDFLTNFAGR